jgi:hypothetical protein
MRIQILALTLFFLVILFATACATNQSGNANSTGNSLASQPAPPPAQDAVNRVFDVTQQNLRAAFDDGRALAQRSPTIHVGQEQSLNVSAQVLRGTETLKLTVTFLSPLDQARREGFERGGGAQPRTPVPTPTEDTALTMFFENRSRVDFRVRLQQPSDSNAGLPTFSYALLDKDGDRIPPTEEPGPLLDNPESHGLLGDFDPAGSPLIFPVFNGAIPNLTSRMDTMVLIVRVDSDEHRLQFQLR